MDMFRILKENMIRFKTKNLNEASGNLTPYEKKYEPWPWWQKNGFNWYSTKYTITATTDENNQPLKLYPIYLIDIPIDNSKLGDDVSKKEAFNEFLKSLKAKAPDYNNPDRYPHYGFIIKTTGTHYILICLIVKKPIGPAIVITSKRTWDALTDRGWRTNSSADSDSIPLDKNVLFTDIYVSGPASSADVSGLSSDLYSLSSANGININKKAFKQAGGRVINRVNVADINHPGVESKLQYAVVFIDDSAYDEIRLETYPDIDDHIYGRGVRSIDKSIVEV
jgi:hypothetical protein